VLTDDGGPITIDFATPVFGVGGYFTHTVPLDLRFFDAGNNLLGSRGSPFDNNLAQSGDPGSLPNEFIGFSAVTASIARVVISGDRFGGSFTLDDLSIDTGATVPEPGTWLLAVALLGAGSLPGLAASVGCQGRRFEPDREDRMSTLLGRRTARALVTLTLSFGALSAADAGTLGTLAMSPDRIVAGQARAVTFSISITDPKYLMGSGNVQRLRADGSVAAVLGNLRDDGLGGDAVPGDKIYSLRAVLNEPAWRGGLPGLCRVQGELRRSFSNTKTLTIDASQPCLAAAAAPSCPVAGCPVVDGAVQAVHRILGLAPVDATKARAAVPADYGRLVGRCAAGGPCGRLCVGQSAACPPAPARWRRSGADRVARRHGNGPDTAINNYTLTYASDSLALVTARGQLCRRRWTAPDLRAQPPPAMAAKSRRRRTGARRFAGQFLRQRLHAGFHDHFQANWWRAEGNATSRCHHGAVISFDFGSQMSFATSRHGVVGALLPGNRLAAFPLSFRGSFDAAVMVVTGQP
jgi:hypothetical protein